MTLTPSNDFIGKEAAISEWHRRRVSQFKENFSAVMGPETLSSIIEGTGLFTSRGFCLAYMNKHTIYASPCFSVFYSGETLAEIDKAVLKALLAEDKTRDRKTLVIRVSHLLEATKAENRSALKRSLDRLRKASLILSLTNPEDSHRMSFTKFECLLPFVEECLIDSDLDAVICSLDPMVHELFD